jgi:type I restriction enzyme S subunit
MPKLRFPEFCGDDVWNEMPLDGLSKRIRRKVGSKELTPVSITAGFGFVDQTKKFGRRIAGEQYKNYIHIQRGDFVYNKGNSKTFAQGCIYQLKEFEEAAASTAFICFKLNASCVDIYFQNLFECNTHGRKLLKFITSGARSDGLLNINPTDFFSIELPLPPRKEEQQRIAECLSSVDEVIAAQSWKLDALKTHKKGLMQELFPREGETQPRLRFPEFQDAPEWVEIDLGDVSSHFKGFAFKSKDYTTCGRRIVRVSDMGFDYIKDETSAIYIKEAKPYEKWKLLKDDLIITTVGSKPPAYDSLVGRTIVVKSKDEGSLLNQNAVCLRANKNIEQGFLNIVFKREAYVSFIESVIRGNANQGSIALLDLFKYIIFKPKPKEQQRIADCLTSLDELIAVQAQKLEALKTHKKGLMQQLFPSPEEEV